MDNETKNIYISPQTGLVTTRGGGTATFTVVLTQAPSANVTVNLVSNDPARRDRVAGLADVLDVEPVEGPDGTCRGR